MTRVEPTSQDTATTTSLLRVAAGDVRAFEAPYDRYSSQAVALAVRITGRRDAAGEATEDTWCRWSRP